MTVIAIIAGMSGPCGAVEIAVHGEEGAVLLPPLHDVLFGQYNIPVSKN